MAIQTVKVGESVNDGTGDPARTCFTKINQNFTDSANAASRLVGKNAGNVVEIGVAGISSNAELYAGTTGNQTDFFDYHKSKSGMFFNNKEGIKEGSSTIPQFSSYIVSSLNEGGFLAIGNQATTPIIWAVTGFGDSRGRQYLEFKTTKNTSVDANGFIKNASPIVKLFADKIELNDEAELQPITLEKLGVGDYLVKGSLGFAQEGWYIEMPKDANGNVLVAVVYKQLENNDISVKTYDYMLNKKGRIVPDLETPLDIPETRWIDLRLQALPQTNPQPLSKDKTDATNAE